MEVQTSQFGHPHHHHHHHHHGNNRSDTQSQSWNFHEELAKQLAVPPSQNTFYKFLHAYNGTNRNNERPAITDDGTGLSGCWLIFKPLQELDVTWETVKTATEEGQLGYRSNVRTMKHDGTGADSDKKVISVCTYNALDVNDVVRVRTALENLGVLTEGEIPDYKTFEAISDDIPCIGQDGHGPFPSV